MSKTVIRKQLTTGEEHPEAICPSDYLRMSRKAETEPWVLTRKLPEVREPLTSSVFYITQEIHLIADLNI